MNFRRQQILDDILRFSAKVSKLRLQAQARAPSVQGEEVVD